MPRIAAAGFARLELRISPPLEDRLIAELWELGTCGTETRLEDGGMLRVLAYFEEKVPAEDPARWRRLGAELLSVQRVAEEDWLRPFRRQAKPFALGRTLLVDPGEPGAAPAAPAGGRRLLRLPARRAFGVGTHASTRLAVELMESTEMAGKRILDLGAGTGILAFLAQLRGARSVVGLEIDLEASLTAAENRRLNRLAPDLVAGDLSCLTGKPWFDLAVANLLPVELEPEIPALGRLLRPGAELIVSGLLREQEEELRQALGSSRFAAIDSRYEREWCALRASYRP